MNNKIQEAKKQVINDIIISKPCLRTAGFQYQNMDADFF